MKQRLITESKVEADARSENVVRQSGKGGLEFDSAESMIRYDVSFTVVPPQLRERLLRELQGTATPLPWWKRWFRS
jgi:hypothetical protein